MENMFKDKGSKTTKKKPIIDMKVNNYICKYCGCAGGNH
jgi:hypothetical protein